MINYLNLMVRQRPLIAIVGGPDVDARIAIMSTLRDKYHLVGIGSDTRLQKDFTQSGFDYYNYPLFTGSNFLKDLLTFTRLLLLLRKLKPDLIHAYDTKPTVWGRLAARLAGVPYIIGTLPGLGYLYAENSLSTRLIRALYQPLQKLACRFSDVTIFQNSDDSEQFVGAGVVAKQKIKVIRGSGIDLDLFDPKLISDSQRLEVRGELGIADDEIVVTMISRIVRSKGVNDYVEAARKISSRNKKVRFLLVGPMGENSPDRLNDKEIEALKQFVIWPGPRLDIPIILSLSDIFVLPSAYREGIPRVLMEAAAMELPLITTWSPGCKEVVDEGVNGFLIAMRDVSALCNSLTSLIEDADLRRRFGTASRRLVSEHFGLPIISKQTHDIYHTLLAKDDSFEKENQF